MAKKKPEKDQDVADDTASISEEMDAQTSDDGAGSVRQEASKRLTTDDLSSLPNDTDDDSIDGSDLVEGIGDEVIVADDSTQKPDIETSANDESTNAATLTEQSLQVDAKSAPETAAVAAEPAYMAPPPPAPKRRSMWPMVFAGLLLAGVGYVVGRDDLINPYLPEEWRMPDRLAELRLEIADLKEAVEGQAGLPEEISDLGASVGLLSERIEGNTAQIEGIDFPEPDFGPVEEKVGALGDRLGMVEAFLDAASDTPDYSAAFAGLEKESQSQQERVAALVKDAEAATAALLKEMEQDKATLLEEAAQARAEAEAAKAAVLEEAAKAEAKAAEVAKTTLAQAALSHLQAAVDAGEPFEDALSDLAEVGFADVPEGLTAVSAEGVPTLSALQVGIADAARNALQAARAEAGAVSGVSGFFQKQLGVRSTEPREGDDPDAVLSRIEAIARSGDLAGALSEAELLPEPALAAMSDWLDGAKARVAAVTALDALAQSLPSN